MVLEGGPGLAKDARADSSFDFCTQLVRPHKNQGRRDCRALLFSTAMACSAFFSSSRIEALFGSSLSALLKSESQT